MPEGCADVVPARDPLNDVDLGAAAATAVRSSSFDQTDVSSSMQDCGRLALGLVGAAKKSLGAMFKVGKEKLRPGLPGVPGGEAILAL